MRPLPLPLRVAAGLAATAADCARDLPTRLAGLPVTVASQAMQMSMRVQQQVTELAIKGDEVLASFRTVEEEPEWATFDEDVDLDTDAGAGQNGHVTPKHTTTGPEAGEDPWAMEEAALAEETAVEETIAEPGASGKSAAPAGIENYDDLSLPSLRARLRSLSLAQLEELLDYERGHEARPSFVGMLTRRIGTVTTQQEQAAKPPRGRR